MRTRARTSSWLVCTAVAGALCLAGTRPAPAETDPALALREEAEHLREEAELAYLDVERDHQRVRSDEWGTAAFAADFVSALDEYVAAARSRPDDSLDAASAVSVARESNIDPPLTRTSLGVVLAETARSARNDPAAPSRDVFVAAARKVFEAPKVEDTWDVNFLGLPVVEALRAAKARLAAIDMKAPAATLQTPPAHQSPPEKVPDKVSEKLAKPAEDLVFCGEKARVWVGPWSGWISDVAEKQNKRQQRNVKLVWIDRYEVTCAQYAAFVETLSPLSRRAMVPQGWTIDDHDVVHVPAGRERHPVTGVTWHQAQVYAESQGKRLPTCDEWDRAASGQDKEPRAFPWGNSEEGRHWAHLGVEPKDTSPVDAFPDDSTPEGVVGLAGNVAELVATYPDHSDVSKSGLEKGRQVLICGGSFTSRRSECASSWRWVIDGDESSPSVGFRCVMDDAEYRKRRK